MKWVALPLTVCYLMTSKHHATEIHTPLPANEGLNMKAQAKSKPKLLTGTGMVQICWDLRLLLSHTHCTAGSNDY